MARKDFFISYNGSDREWAEWIAWTLEEEAFSVVLQAWDFRPGEIFILEMQNAVSGSDRTLAVLTDRYLQASYTQPEWAGAFVDDPGGQSRKLIPVRVEECSPQGMLKPLIYIDLVGLAEEKAREALLEGLRERGKPAKKPLFPGIRGLVFGLDTRRVMPEHAPFPGGSGGITPTVFT